MASPVHVLDDTRVRKLISAYLLSVGPDGATPTQMRDDLAPLLSEDRQWHARIGAALGQMEKAGHLLAPAMIDPRFRLSDQGITATRHWLHLPPEWSGAITWQDMLEVYLPCMALHLAPPLDLTDRDKIDEMLQAAVLVRHYHLPVEGSPTLARVRGLLVIRQFEKMLGLHPGEARLKSPPAGRAATLLLCPLLGLRTSRSSPGKLTLQLVTHVLGIDDLGGVKARVLAMYLTRSEGLRPRTKMPKAAAPAKDSAPPTAPVSAEDFIGPMELPPPPSGPIVLPAAGGLPDPGDAGDRSLRQFAKTVLAAARGTKAGGSGASGNGTSTSSGAVKRTYISLIWRRVQAQNMLPGVDEAHFKRLLTLANNRGVLELVRADPSESHDPAELEASRTRYLSSEFHYLLLTAPPEVA